MGPITARVEEAAQTCGEQLPFDEVLSQGFQFGSPCSSKTSCFTAPNVGIEKKKVFRTEF